MWDSRSYLNQKGYCSKRCCRGEVAYEIAKQEDQRKSSKPEARRWGKGMCIRSWRETFSMADVDIKAGR